MQSSSTIDSTEGEAEGPSGTAIRFALPVRESDLFKHSASAPILNFLSDNPEIHLSIRQLSRVTSLSERATREAVDVLEANDLLDTFHEGNARRVQINRRRLQRSDDPVWRIPQPEFRLPVRIGCRYIEDELGSVGGILLFGSVARGDADRQSDIDLWVLVEGDRMQQRHEANKLARKLSELRIPPSIPVDASEDTAIDTEWESIRDRLEDGVGDSNAQRYAFELIVETPQSIINQADRVDPEELFGEGITLRSTETLERVKMEVLDR